MIQFYITAAVFAAVGFLVAKVRYESSVIEDQRMNILEKVEEHKVPKEATKINTTGADYIFVYDLKNILK